MADPGPLRIALRIARVSTPALTNRRTAVTSLVAVPVLGVLLLVAVAASAGGTDLVATASAGVLVTFGLSIVAGTVAQISRDRQLGVIQQVLAGRFFSLPYWLGKVAVLTAVGACVAVAGSLAVFLVDPTRSTDQLAATLGTLPVVAVAGALVSVAAGTFSIGLRDPYLVSNALHGVLPITAGVVVPLAAYPTVLALAGTALPFSGAVEAMRSVADGASTVGASLSVLRELGVCAVWCVAGALTSRRVMADLRSGRRSEDIW